MHESAPTRGREHMARPGQAPGDKGLVESARPTRANTSQGGTARKNTRPATGQRIGLQSASQGNFAQRNHSLRPSFFGTALHPRCSFPAGNRCRLGRYLYPAPAGRQAHAICTHAHVPAWGTEHMPTAHMPTCPHECKSRSEATTLTEGIPSSITSMKCESTTTSPILLPIHLQVYGS